MSTHPDENHARLLAQILAGDEDPRVALARSPLADCAACVAELEDLRALAGAYQALGLRERADLAAARAAAALHATEATPAWVRAQAALRDEIASTAQPRASARPLVRRWLVGMAAAAALVLAVLLLFGERRDARHDLIMGAGIRALGPVGEVDAYAPFTWEDPQRSGRYVVRIIDASASATHTEVLVSEPLDAPRFDPPAADLPAAIRWMVEVSDAASPDHVIARSAWIDARLRPSSR